MKLTLEQLRALRRDFDPAHHAYYGYFAQHTTCLEVHLALTELFGAAAADGTEHGGEGHTAVLNV